MRFLHTSDLHLGKVFHNTSLLEHQKYALEQIVELLVQREVDGLIIAGDLYDRAVPPESAVALLNEFLSKVCIDLKIPTFVIAGNHDSGERLGFASGFLSRNGLHMAGPVTESVTPCKLEKAGQVVDIFLIPYAHPRSAAQKLGLGSSSHQDVLEALVDRARDELTDGRPAVLVSHCFVAGGEVSDSERRLTVGGSEQVSASIFKGFDYTALGHLHAPQNRGDAIRYSGSLLKYSFSEVNHDKGVTVVDIGPDGQIEIEHVAITPTRDVREIEGTFAQLMANAATDPRADDFLRIRLTDEQTVPNAMAQLQQVYPNALELSDVARREYERGVGKNINAVEQQTPLNAFEDFYRAVMEEPLDEEGRNYMVGVIEAAERAEEANP